MSRPWRRSTPSSRIRVAGSCRRCCVPSTRPDALPRPCSARPSACRRRWSVRWRIWLLRRSTARRICPLSSPLRGGANEEERCEREGDVHRGRSGRCRLDHPARGAGDRRCGRRDLRSEEHTSELQSLAYLVCRLLLEKKKKDETV